MNPEELRGREMSKKYVTGPISQTRSDGTLKPLSGIRPKPMPESGNLTVPENKFPVVVTPDTCPPNILTELRERMARVMGIAHDINNALMPLNILNESEDRERCRRTCERASDKIKELTTELYRLARKPIGEHSTWIDISEILITTAMSCITGHDIDLQLTIESSVYIKIDPEQFARIIQNLINNALWAMNYQGSLKIDTKSSRYENAQRFIEILISDSGCGITPENLPQIFDAYFTTKEHGHGLGLAFVKNLVECAGGRISVISKPGSGSSFTLRFPTLETEDTEKP
ncbi:MAG: ATP-binding protein [Patescibacteria group bacterium]